MALAMTVAPYAAQAARAAPADQGCQARAFFQFDLAGTYVSQAALMRVEIYPCGGTLVQWDNAFGTHYAGYYSDTRLTGGGIAAGWLPESSGKLDMADRIGFKPAEPGYLQVITVSPYGGIAGIYRLAKIS
jgi:hypothetical protein